MTDSIQDLQSHFQFQLSLLRLTDVQKLSGSIPNSPAVEIAEHQDLQAALSKITRATY
jgi:hypothetical protein